MFGYGGGLGKAEEEKIKEESVRLERKGKERKGLEYLFCFV